MQYKDLDYLIILKIHINILNIKKYRVGNEVQVENPNNRQITSIQKYFKDKNDRKSKRILRIL